MEYSNRLPEAVEHVAVRVHPQHDIVCGGVMDKGPLGVNKEHIRNPDLLNKPTVEGHALVVGAGERQALVLPVVTQIKRHGEVLHMRQRP